MSGAILTDARVKALRPRGTAYDIRDANLKGFGVRVSPSGCKRYFVHCQHRGARFWKIVQDAWTMGPDEARSCAVRTLATIRRGEGPPEDPAETRFEAIAETVFERHRRLWKPGTLTVNRSYLKNQILPHLQGQQVADIDRRSVCTWFASLRATPVAADRSMPVLSVILKEAEHMGLRPEGSNPCLGIRRYRCKGQTRFLSDTEIRHLAAGLSAREQTAAFQVAAVRLLLLTGLPQERDSHTPLVRLPRGAPLPARLARRFPAPCGCRARARGFSTGWGGPDTGCSRGYAATGPRVRAGSKTSGTRFAPNPTIMNRFLSVVRSRTDKNLFIGEATLQFVTRDSRGLNTCSSGAGKSSTRFPLHVVENRKSELLGFGGG